MESWTRLLLPLALLVWSSGAVWAQSNTARLVGTVKDSSGAVLPGVSIQASSLETGLSRTVTTNDLGDYVITNLPVGRYEVTAELSGFKRLKQGPLQLLVTQTARIDLTLEIGQISETVTAESTAPIIDTETNTLGSVIDETQMKEIPLNGRNFIQLGHLVPGTTTGPPAATTVRTRQGGVSLTANGQRQDQNNWLLDGVDNNAQFFGMVVIVPSVDAIREFKVQTSNYSAEFGRSAGAVVSLETKSGTNRFSGTAYEFLRNDVLDAAEFFAARDAAGQKIKAPLTFNQFGASFGGPILKDRTFFFANYEGKRVRRGKTVGSFVPTAAMREGNYAGLPTLYDPLTYSAATGLRQPFPENRIPANRIFPASKAMLTYIPEPNNADPSRNFVRVVSDRDDGNQYHIRGDHRFSSKQWITGRFSYYDTDNVTGFAFPLDADVLLNRHRSVVLQHTYTLSPRVINEFRLGGTRYHFIYNHETAGEPYTEKFGLPSAAPNSQIDGFPDTRITGLARLGGNAAVPLDRIENTINLIDNINWVQGNHSVKIGGEIRSYRTKNYQPQWGRGRYTFTGVFTAQAGGRYSDGFADFLLGFPAGQNLLNTTGLDAQRPQNWRQTLYVQDDWKIWPRLTLNIGLRYERDGAWTDAHDRTALFDATRGEVVYARDWDISIPIPFPHRFGDSNNIVDTTHGWAPRAGFAWSPFGSSFVIRGGYGVFWSLNTAQSMINTGFIPPGLIQDLQTSGSIVPAIIFGQSAFGSDPSMLLPAQPSFTALPFGLRKNPYTQQWNLTVEKELGAQHDDQRRVRRQSHGAPRERLPGQSRAAAPGRGPAAPACLAGLWGAPVPGLRRVLELSGVAGQDRAAVRQRTWLPGRLYLVEGRSTTTAERPRAPAAATRTRSTGCRRRGFPDSICATASPFRRSTSCRSGEDASSSARRTRWSTAFWAGGR